MILTVATIMLSVVLSVAAILNLVTIKYMQRTLKAHSEHLAACDRRLSNAHESIMDLYNRCNRIESK